MKNQESDFPLERERYELQAPGPYHFDLARRDFFKIAGAGLVIACALKNANAAQESGRGGRWRGEELPQDISAWLHIGEDGKVAVFTGKAEMGQNIRTSLTQAVAEELKVSPSVVSLTMGDTALTPFDMGTFGSRTTPTMSPQLRRAASTAKELLLELAGKEWNENPAKLIAEDSKVRERDGNRSLDYGQLVAGRKLAKMIPAEDPLTPAQEWQVMGTSLPKIHARDFVTGKHRYASDLVLPGMLHGKVMRPPSFGATMTSVDISAAAALPGVTVVHDGDFVGLTAPSLRQAGEALAKIHAEWKTVPQPSRKELFDYLKQTAEKGHEEVQKSVGSMESGLAAGDHKLGQTFTVAYIAHAPLEPRAALAKWENGKVTVWTGSQRPFGVRDELTNAFRIPKEQVRVIIPDTGSAYGGKHTGEAAVEAARLAKTAKRPVKLVWTREEEFTWAYLRPAGVMEVSAAVKDDGTVTAWEFHNYNSGAAAILTPYDIANQNIVFHPTQSPLRQGSYRALAATANHFVRESAMDELADLAKMDPLEFRLKNLTNARLRTVFQAAAEKFGWGKSHPTDGHGYGIAGGIEKGGHVATCAEVAVDKSQGTVKILRLVTAFDCGAVVNPDHLRNQIEGAMMMGIGGAMFEAIDFADGKILNAFFSRYRVPRFGDLPRMEVVLVDRKDLPSAGAGETPIVGVAPAVGNAIFAASGIRIRSLPMVPEGLKA
jgi:CO/xanthine dehydrogenase Mo-binding subunit